MKINYTKKVEKWGLFEFSAEGRIDGNPFTERAITARFESKSECRTVSGFYDAFHTAAIAANLPSCRHRKTTTDRCGYTTNSTFVMRTVRPIIP